MILMGKIYQIFVSSTYLDLIKERKAVMEALTRINCIPRGMELFPSQNTAILNTIKNTMTECDYYVLIVGGKYGSVDKTKNLSYTEIEFGIALSKKIPILAFLPQNLDDIPIDKREKSAAKNKKLKTFIDLVKSHSTPAYWNSKSDLALKVNSSVHDVITNFPRAGLIKGSIVDEPIIDCFKLYETKLNSCLGCGIYDEYISRNIFITPNLERNCFIIRSHWKFKCVSLKGNLPEFSFNHNSSFSEFLSEFKMVTYNINGNDFTEYAKNKLEMTHNKKLERYFILFHDNLKLNKQKFAEVECIYEYITTLPTYNSYSSYMYPAKSRDVKVTIEGKDSGKWILKANSFAAFRNLGNNLNAVWSNRDNYEEIKADSSYNLNIKEWTLPGTGFAFSVLNRDHVVKCWLATH